MPLFGAHMSIAGGCANALLAAKAHQCATVQLFTKSSNQWKAKDITAEDARQFRRAGRGSGLRCTMAHDSRVVQKR